MEALEYRVERIEDLDGAAGHLLSARPNSRVMAFYGAMGVGKTTFIKAICDRLGVSDRVSSPSFPIVNQYVMEGGGQVFHFDFYRIKKPDEAFDLGFEEYIYSGHYCFIEWPEKVEELLPGDCLKVHMEDREGIRLISS